MKEVQPSSTQIFRHFREAQYSGHWAYRWPTLGKANPAQFATSVACPRIPLWRTQQSKHAVPRHPAANALCGLIPLSWSKKRTAFGQTMSGVL